MRLFDPARVPTTRYRYRGPNIPAPWSVPTGSVAWPCGGADRQAHREEGVLRFPLGETDQAVAVLSQVRRLDCDAAGLAGKEGAHLAHATGELVAVLGARVVEDHKDEAHVRLQVRSVSNWPVANRVLRLLGARIHDSLKRPACAAAAHRAAEAGAVSRSRAESVDNARPIPVRSRRQMIADERRG